MDYSIEIYNALQYSKLVMWKLCAVASLNNNLIQSLFTFLYQIHFPIEEVFTLFITFFKFLQVSVLFSGQEYDMSWNLSQFLFSFLSFFLVVLL